MTDIIKVIDILPDEAKHLAQRLHRKKDELEIHRKSLLGEVESASDEERAIVARVSTNDRDRDGEIVEPKGIDLKDFTANPVLLWAHSYSTPPVGKALWSKTDDRGLICKFQFAKTQFADEIYTLYRDGYLKAFSIGFIPVDFDTKEKVYKRISLLEVSAVPVPANQNALVMEAYAKGIVTSEALKKDLGIEEPVQESAVSTEVEQAEDVNAEPESGVEIPAEDEAKADEPAAPADDMVDEPEEKAFDLKGNPSVYDIMLALSMALNQPADVESEEAQSQPWREIVDLYPYDYPSGACVVGEFKDGAAVHSQQKYRYADGKATLQGDPVAVAPGYVRRSIDAALIMDEVRKAIKSFEAKLVEAVQAKATPSEPAPTVEAEPCKPEPEGSTPSAGSIRITAADPPPKTAGEELLDFIRSQEFRDLIRLEVDKSIGRVR